MTSKVLVIWLKAGRDYCGRLRGVGINIIDKAQESHQTMTQTMSEILSLKIFSFKSRGLREWKAYDVGPGKPCNTRLFQCTDTAVSRKVFRQNRTRQYRKALWVMEIHGPWLRF